ncbi:winged helix-turn-helix transcriptional regulator [Allokutzneria sp. A3M-2-11 16]|uniref:winged helix-turn-helix transcriptional regulator n=1 Tax=Allokutzneria sp. A3M-2-11 16 TaxID=2962043 RepID=UPI0035A94B91
MLTGKWVPAVLAGLSDGRPRRFGELAKAIRANQAQTSTPVQDRVLAQTLERMEGDGLVVRTERPGCFPRVVTYRLTEKAKDLIKALGPLGNWAS